MHFSIKCQAKTQPPRLHFADHPLYLIRPDSKMMDTPPPRLTAKPSGLSAGVSPIQAQLDFSLTFWMGCNNGREASDQE
jgi:hypothetical protein